MSNVTDLTLFGDAITSTATGIKLDGANALALSAYNKTIGVVAVDAFIYDTSKDSDGGAWRKRTQHTSWYNETLNTATRGSRKEFPAVAVIVIEATKMTIYDGDEPDCPMWMVFNYILGAHSFITYSDRSLSSVAALNGNIVLGGDDNVDGSGHVHIINFLKDNHERYTTVHSIAPENISQRNEIVNYVPFGDGQSLAQVTVYDVAITSLPAAPIDDATGLPIPTIAVASQGGLSVILDSGTRISPASQADYGRVDFQGNRLWFQSNGPSSVPIRYVDVPFTDGDNYIAPYSWPGNASYPYSYSNYLDDHLITLPDGIAAHDNFNGLVQVFSGRGIAQSNDLTRYFSTSYNTGWLVGDNKLVTLSDTTEETIGSVDYSDTSPADGSELISNGTFDTDTTGWTAVNSTIETDTDRLKITNTSAGVYGDATFTFSVTANEEYYINWEAVAGTGSIFIQILGQGDDTGYISAVPTTSAYFYPTSSGDVTITVRVTEISTSAVPVDAGDYAFIDNISVVQKNDIIYNGRFDGGTLGWTVGGTGASVAEVSGELELTQTAGQTGYVYQTIDTVVDQMYKLTVTLRTGTGTTANIHIGNAEVLTNYGIISEISGTNVTQTIIFRAGVTTTYITLINNVAAGGTGYFDNISVVETTELIVNGEFTYDTTGWSFEGTGTDTSAPGYLEYTAGVAVNTCATQAINTEIGKLYYVEADFGTVTTAGAIYIGTSAFGTDVGSTQFVLGGNKIFNTFKATTTTTYISLVVGSGTETGRFDNVSVKEADELVENGDFGRLTTGWTAENANPGISISNGRLTVDDTNDGGNDSKAYQDITTEVGKTYVMSFDKISTTSLFYFAIGTPAAYNSIYYSESLGTTTGPHFHTFVATDTTTRISLITANDGVTVYDNVSVRLAEVDRSTYQNGLQIHGQLTKSVVAPGAELVAYSGWSSEHYLEQPYNSQLDFGTGDFYISTWFYYVSNGDYQDIIARTSDQSGIGGGWTLQLSPSAQLLFYIVDSGYQEVVVASGTNMIENGWNHIVVQRRDGNFEAYNNSNLLTNTAATTYWGSSVTNTNAKVTICRRSDEVAYPIASTGKVALPKISATAPTAEQIAKMYNDEKFLFQDNAQATLYGTSDAVTALAYDEKTELLHAGTSQGRSVFQGLRRVDNTTDAVATTISARNQMIAEQ